MLGLSIIIKHVFNVDIPVGKFFVAFILIYLGVQIMTGGHGRGASCGTNVIFSHGFVSGSGKDNQYNVVFGTGDIDLTGIELKDKDLTVEANTVFGSSTLKLKAGIPTIVQVNDAFGEVRMPDRNIAAFGNYVYRTKSYQEGKPHLELKLNSVFSSVRVVEE